MSIIATWPLVDPNDDGIRPAGRPDECMYCQQRVGTAHTRECIIVTKRVEMRVTAMLPSGTFTGLWQFDDPHEWDAGMTEFSRNESLWCAGSFCSEHDKGTVTWDTVDPWQELLAIDEAAEAGGDCLCNNLEFSFVRVVDWTPRRGLKVERRPLSDVTLPDGTVVTVAEIEADLAPRARP